MKKRTFILSFLCLLSNLFLSAHGVGYKILKGGIGVDVYYEDVEKTPMSYAKVKIFTPKNEEFKS